ncbi:endonuclease domain-containing protein [Sphingomonas sp. IC-11]|uniref:endonuclease domain-containing protein n=1 Tax=Sphingomonas sp. IC-11 TaxID=2898528 RepID=UPI0022AA695F|nr:endonuclease domain-containing protein [Sphingomonas sp. IC-11]
MTGPQTTVTNARRLRREMTLPEIILWQNIRRQQLGVKFRKQHPAGQYVLDFYCPSARLAIEVDGEAHSHQNKLAKDHRRDLWLARENVRILRIPAKAILSDLPNVIDAISAAVTPDQPLHQPAAGPPPRSGEDLELKAPA